MSETENRRLIEELYSPNEVQKRLLNPIIEAADSALGRGGLSPDDEMALFVARNELGAWFDTLLDATDHYELARIASFEAVRTAFLIGAVAAKDVPDDVKAELRKKLTEKANLARRRGDIQEIIEEEARKLWARKPELQTRFSDTARFIGKNVIDRIGKLGAVPQEWRPPALDGGEENRKFLDKLRKRLKRIPQPDE